MSTWLKLLPLEIQDVKDLLEPTEEVKQGENVVGVVTSELRKIWTLSKSLGKSAELLEVEMKYAKASTQEHGKMVELRAKARGLETIFWIGVMDELQLWGHSESCALRVDWQVVEFKQPEFPFPFKILGE